MKKVLTGLDILSAEKAQLVRNRRLGLVAHPASVTSDLRHTLDVLTDLEARVEMLFGPEHGFGGEAQDMEPVKEGTAGPRGLPLFSLYGSTEETLAPSVDSISTLDALVIDLADVGSRYYTFVWTAVLCLRACHAAGVDLIVLDRPNPLGGEIIEGASQSPGFESFVGLLPVPNRHGLTIGEIVRMAARREGSEAALTVVEMRGWNREMLFDETGLPWVLPSPNMPTSETALIYPGGCLLEGTWASEGKGTTRPFELFGAPGINGVELASVLNEMGLPGVLFRPTSFKPTFQKHANDFCGGAQAHVTDRSTFRPYRTGAAILLALHRVSESFAWRAAPYEFVADIPAIDLLTGSTAVREGVEADANLEELAAGWAVGQAEFEKTSKTLHLY